MSKTERELAEQVLAYYNGSWLYRHHVAEQIKSLDPRYSERAVRRALEDLAKADICQKRRSSAGGYQYRILDPDFPRREWNEGVSMLSIRPSSRADDLEWPDA